MAKSIIGTDASKWTAETLTQATAFGAGFVSISNPPTSTPASGYWRCSPDPAGTDPQFNQIAAIFVSTGAPTKQAEGRIWGISKVGTNDCAGVLLGEFTLTLGTAAGVATFVNTTFFKAITVDTDSSNLPPGIRILGDNGNRAAMLLIDAVGFQYVVIELRNKDLGANAYLGVAWRPL